MLFVADAVSVLARGHTHVFFKYERKGGDGIKTQHIGNSKKGNVFPNQSFCLVDFKAQVRLIDSCARLFTEKGAKLGRTVVQLVAQILQTESAVYLRAQNPHDFVLQFSRIGNFGNEKYFI